MTDPFGDIPLFREIQKVLASGSGPVNLEIARQVAGALNQDAPSSGPDAQTKRALDDAVHRAEQLVSGYARLAPDEPIRAEIVGRSEWISTTLDAWGWLLVHLAQRLSGEVTRFAGEESGEGEGASEGLEASSALGPVMGQIAPLLLGMQAGTLVGHLARESLGRYDPPIPREDSGRLFFVGANVDSTANDYGFDKTAFLDWLAVRDVARHLVATAHPWVGRYWRSLLVELVDSIEIDRSDLERRLMDFQTRGPEALQEGAMGGEMLPIVPTDRHRKARDRVSAFAALLEGYAAHVGGAVAGGGEAAARVEEGMRRRDASPSEGATMLQALIGIGADRSWNAAGATFCAAIAELKGPNRLEAVWRAPDNLPTLEEIKDPFAWIERVLQEE